MAIKYCNVCSCVWFSTSRDVRPGFPAGRYLTPLHDVRRFGGFKQYGSYKKTNPGGDFGESPVYSLREPAGSEDKL